MIEIIRDHRVGAGHLAHGASRGHDDEMETPQAGLDIPA
jgi:hypothetical protein